MSDRQRDLWAREAIAQIPKILTLLDRNPHSPTYGCGDRNFWHYKIIDFPSGMAQEFVYPLALAYTTPCPDNPFYQQPAMGDWVEAGIVYAAKSAHPDGSCDDYFPFERASGAAAFSLLAALESYELLELDSNELLQFFARRATWLSQHQESGRLTNHQALIVLCLERLSEILGTSQWDRAKALRLEQILDWQSEEGWFPEYEGCDPGYQTLTISCLARVEQLRPDIRLREALAKAVELTAQFLHPDGSFGGEYTSRNTYNYFPHGFELVGRWFPQALAINDVFLAGLDNGLNACYADDHIIGHHTWNYLLAWRDFVTERPASQERNSGQVWLKSARLLVDRRENWELYVALNKGGAFKLFRDRQLLLTDTQFSLQVRQGKTLKNAVGHLVGDYDIAVEPDKITVSGALGWAKQTQMTTLKLIVLRGVMLVFGRFFPNLIRHLLQQILIVGKNKAPFSFQRQFIWKDGGWLVCDELRSRSWDKVEDIGIGSTQTSIYVVMSRTFQRSQLQPWQHLGDRLATLKGDATLKLERYFK